MKNYPLPTTISEFKIVNSKPLGSGAFCEVILVYHINNPSKRYALKKLNKKDTKNLPFFY